MNLSRLRYGPRLAWRWLTSMRTALILLFLLAAAAIPGVFLPQRNVNETKVDNYIATGGSAAKIYDKLQLFDVYSSHWFTAIYVLLFVSLIGCILPRALEQARALTRPIPSAPKNLSRLPLYREATVDGSVGDVMDKAAARLKGWRTTRADPSTDRAGGYSIAGEKGMLREVGNLVFHLGLVGLLVTIATGRLVYYEGQVIVVAGERNSQFCNTAFANYDSYRWGALVDGTNLDKFCVDVKDFTAKYLRNGQADSFSANVAWAWGNKIFTPSSSWMPYDLRVNHPLRIHGNRIYLQGHGYAPRFTITWPDGVTRTQTVQFKPDDLVNFTSSGAMRFDPPAGMYPSLLARRQHQIALQGLFAPTASFMGKDRKIMVSTFPAMRNPGVAIDIYRGDTGLDAGRGQSIFGLDPGQIHSGALKKLKRVNLMAGQKVTLDDGTTLRFDGATPFVNLQISHDPTELWVLVSAIVTLIGLVLSLALKRRRVWIRAVAGDKPGTAVVTIGGLARTDRAGWGRELDRIATDVTGIDFIDDDDSEDLYGFDGDRGAADKQVYPLDEDGSHR